jgi:hypothetical protein
MRFLGGKRRKINATASKGNESVASPLEEQATASALRGSQGAVTKAKAKAGPPPAAKDDNEGQRQKALAVVPFR